MARKLTFGISWNNITKLSWIYFFAAFYFYLPFLTLYYQARGLNLLQISSLQSIIIGITFFANIPTGVFADKFGRRNAIIVSLALQLTGEVLFFFARSYPAFIAIAVIAGLGFSFTIGSVSALMFDSLKEENRENEMSKETGTRMSVESAARIIAPFLGGLIIVQFTINHFMTLIILTIISVLMGFLLTFFLKEPKKETVAENKKNSLTLFKRGILLFKQNANFRRIVLLSLFTNPLIPYLFILYPPYFVKAHVSQIWFGLALSVGSLFSLVGNKYAYWFEKKLGVDKGILLATLFPALLYFSLAFIYQPLLSFLLFCLIYLPNGLQDPLFTDYQNRHIESENRATVISLISMLNNIYIALIGLVIGYLADKSINIAFIGIGIFILLSSFLFRINVTHVITVTE